MQQFPPAPPSSPAVISAAVYVRVSTEDQAHGDRYSIQSQLADCRRLAVQRGAVVIGEYVDAERYTTTGGETVEPSARRSDRPAWRAMLAAVASGQARAVVALDASRLYGDYEPAAQFTAAIEQAGADVWLVTEPWHADYAMLPAMARRAWYKQHAWRYQAGIRGRVERGLHPNSRVPPFWRVVRDERGKSVAYELLPEHRQFLDDLARLFIERRSYSDIAMILRTHPITGGPLWPANIRLWMVNPWFLGHIDYGRRVGKAHLSRAGNHAPAWDAETCAQIEQELARRASIGRKVAHHGRFLLSGILRCGVCGASMTGTDNHGYPHYVCGMARYYTRGLRPGPAHVNTISERRVMEQLRAAIRTLTPADVDEFLAALAPAAPATGADPDRLAELQAERDELRADIERASARGRGALLAELRRVELELADLETRQEAADDGRAVPPAAVRAEMLAIIAEPERLDLPAEQLRPILARAFPALYVAGKELSGPPGGEHVT